MDCIVIEGKREGMRGWMKTTCANEVNKASQVSENTNKTTKINGRKTVRLSLLESSRHPIEQHPIQCDGWSALFKMVAVRGFWLRSNKLISYLLTAIYYTLMQITCFNLIVECLQNIKSVEIKAGKTVSKTLNILHIHTLNDTYIMKMIYSSS